MANTRIALKKSPTPGSIPAAGNLANGELAINYADGIIYYKNVIGQIAQISSGNFFGTINSNGSIITATLPGDIVSIAAGQNITISTDIIHNSLTIGADLTPANGRANIVAAAGNSYTNYVGASANAYASALTPDLSPVFKTANAAFYAANSTNGWANIVGAAANAYAYTTYATQSTVTTGLSSGNSWATTIGLSGNSYALSLQYQSYARSNTIAVSANNWSNTKLSNTDGITFGGTLNISNSLRVNNNITGVNSIFLNTTSTAAANSSVVGGQLTWNPDDMTVDVGTGTSILQLGQEQYVRILNQSGETIYNANAVAYYGTVGNSGKLLGRRAIANNSYDSKNILGIATEDIPNGSEGFVTTYGKIHKIDTSMFSEGDILYVSSSVLGALQNTKPTAPNNKVQIGTVITKSAQNGMIFAAVQRGSSLADDELAAFNGGLSEGDLIRYAFANGRFENVNENTVGPAVNAIAAFVKANAAYTVANSSNGWSNTLASSGNTYSRYVANSANNYANNTFLQLTGGTVSGNIVANNISVGADISVGRNLTVQGNLFVYGSATTVAAQNLTLTDNILYLNEAQIDTITNASGNGTYQTYTANNNMFVGGVVRVTGMNPSGYNTSGYVTVTAANSTSFSISGTQTGAYVSGGTAYFKAAINPDLGFSGGYNDGTYRHAGFFRDATDGTFKVFEGYTPEPDVAVNIDTTDASFAFAKFQAERVTANTFYVGTQNLQSTLHFAYDAANAAYTSANVGFVGANNWANTVSTAANNYSSRLSANIAAGANNYAGTLANSSNVWANTVGTAGNNYATLTYATQSSQATGFASINSFASYVGTSTNNYTTATYATLGSVASNWAVTNAAYTQANTSINNGASNWSVTNAVYTIANTARDSLASNWAVSNLTAGIANAAYAATNSEFVIQNTAFASINSNWTVTNASYTKANSALPNVSGVTFVGDVYVINNIGIGNSSVNSISLLTSSATDQILDSFSTSAWRSANYVVTMTSGASYHTTQVTLIHDGTNAYITEYGTIYTTDNLGIFSAVIVAGSVRLNVTPTYAVTTINMVRTTNK